MPIDRPTFSQSWSRVNRLTPRLRPEVQVRRRAFRGQPWYILHNPVGAEFFRLSPVGFHFVGLLDGQRSVDDAWRLSVERHGDDAPTQNEVIGLLGQLNQSNLLRVDLSADSEPLLRRRSRKDTKKWAGQAMSLMFLRLPLFNPDSILRWLSPVFRPMLSGVGLALWAVWVALGIWTLLPHLSEFVRDAGSVLAPANWGWLAVVFVVVKIIHESGHGLMCRRFGGQVHEAGVMLLVLMPAPYVDTTSSWGFESKWKRILVGSAGMMFELAVAAAAAVVWVYSEPASLPRQIAHNTVIVASVATVLFNANPLMRFDGYFILSDWLEVPNLYDRANRHLQYLWQRHAFGLRSVVPVSTRSDERAILTIYGIAAMIYRVLVMVAIVGFIAGWAFTLGLFLAAWTVATWLLVPSAKFLHYLSTSAALHRQRTRAVLVSAGVGLLIFVGVGLIPAPEHARTQGVVEAAERAELLMRADGFVDQVLAEVGQDVRKGQVLLRASNPELASRRDELEARVVELDLAMSEALASEDGSARDRRVIAAQLEATRNELREVRDQLDGLILKAPIDGRLAGQPLAPLAGQWLKRSQPVAVVMDLSSLRVTALMDQSANTVALLNEVGRVELRPAGLVHRSLPASLQRVFDSGRSHLPHPALGPSAGGTVATDPKDQKQVTALRPQFELWLALPAQRPAGLLPGQRVYVRFTLAQRRPYLSQWIDRLHRVLREKVVL